MIRLLTGTVATVEAHTIIVDTPSGVGYLVTVPARLCLLPNESVRLYTYLAVRETALDLYGFVSNEDLVCFEALLTISGIGPKSAMQILDQADRTLIAEAVRLEDPTHLTKLSSVSKKTAEKIVLGLKDKLNLTSLTEAPVSRDGTTYQDAFDTLVTLGYNPQSVRQVLDGLPATDGTSSLVTAALRLLS